MFESAGRQIGVTLPADQVSGGGKAPVQQVTHMVSGQMHAIRYGDEFGKEHHVVLFKVGNQWYFPPNAETWASQLKPCAKWLVDELEGKLAQITQDGAVPTKDAVDVVAANVATTNAVQVGMQNDPSAQ